MTISFSGLASGLDTDSWVESLVSIRQVSVTSLQTQKTELENTRDLVTTVQVAFNSLRSSIEKLTDSKLGNAYDLFANKKGLSSDDNVFTATASNSAVNSNYSILVKQLATNSAATSIDSVSNFADDETALSALGITSGDFIAYVNGEKCNIDIELGDTIGDLKSKLEEHGIDCFVDSDGKLNLLAEGKDLAVGTTSDISNFATQLGFEKNIDSNTGNSYYISSATLYKVDLNSKLTETGMFKNGDITAGTFTIGNAEFEIDENTTLGGLINSINSNKDSFVTANWNSTEGKLCLNSTVSGESYINIERGTSNCTNVFGFTSGDTAETSAFVASAQTLGQNAKIIVDGSKTVISSSNTVSSDASGLDGVTLFLKGVSKTEETSQTQSPSKLTVEFDSSSLVASVNEFIENYNGVMKALDSSTEYGAGLFGDTSLNTIKRSLRNSLMSAFENEGNYSLLSSIGISTAKIGTTDDADFTSLELDEKKFKDALNTDFTGVKNLLVGTGENTGILSKAETVIENAVAPEGYFLTKLGSSKIQISRYSDKITAMQKRVAAYREQLEAQFSAMEDTIAAMQSSYNSFLSSGGG